MKTILCPCDFSTTALSGIEFAAAIARQINGNITLCHVQTSVWPEAVFLDPIVEESFDITNEKMEVIAENLIKQFGVKTNFINPRSTDTVESIIGNLSEDYDLIIMGTNGVDDVFQYLFGSTSFNVAKSSLCPVILVPDEYGNHIPHGLIYSHRENVNPDLDILVPLWWSQLMNIPFGVWLNPSGDEIKDKQMIRSVSEELKTGGPENLISFIEMEPAAEKYNPHQLWMRALAINRNQASSGKNSGLPGLRKLSATTRTPVLVFSIGD